jgi:hypothetical protein
LFSLTTAQLVPIRPPVTAAPKPFSCPKVNDDCAAFSVNPCRLAPLCKVTGSTCCATSCTAFAWFGTDGTRITECNPPPAPVTTLVVRITPAPSPACDVAKCPSKTDVFAQCANKPGWEFIPGDDRLLPRVPRETAPQLRQRRLQNQGRSAASVRRPKP